MIITEYVYVVAVTLRQNHNGNGITVQYILYLVYTILQSINFKQTNVKKKKKETPRPKTASQIDIYHINALSFARNSLHNSEVVILFTNFYIQCYGAVIHGQLHVRNSVRLKTMTQIALLL